MNLRTTAGRSATVLLALGLAALPVVGKTGSSPEAVLNLVEAERLALEDDPAATRFRARAGALRERAVADAQLPDPALRLGFMRDEMDEAQIGVMQMFPRGRTLPLRGDRARTLSSAEEARAAGQELRVVRSVRNAWLEALYQARAGTIIGASREVFARLIDITEQQYAAGRGDMQDVLRARLELSMLDDRLTRSRVGEDAARAELGKWIGPQAAARPLPAVLPDLPPLAGLERLVGRLPEHPLLRVEEAMITTSDIDVDLAKQSYRPGWTLDLTYGRVLDDPGMGGRDNSWSVMATVDLPLFTARRQDRQLAAARLEAAATRDGRADLLRELRGEIEREYSAWLGLGERLELYERDFLPQSEQNAQAALRAYQARATEFSMLMRAYLMALENRLNALRVEADRARTHANLLYYGE